MEASSSSIGRKLGLGEAKYRTPNSGKYSKEASVMLSAYPSLGIVARCRSSTYIFQVPHISKATKALDQEGEGTQPDLAPVDIIWHQ